MTTGLSAGQGGTRVSSGLRVSNSYEFPDASPAPGLHHVGFVHRGHGQAFHRSGQVFTDLK
jgi:hypothetical protein